METIDTEVLVIGSGFGAAAPALRLAQAGASVLVIEKGPDIVPERDFRQTQDPRYLMRYIRGDSSSTVGYTYAEGLGGGSGFYEMISLRAPARVFDQRDRHGRRYWPAGINRTSMDPWYAMAERMLNVTQIAPEEVPRTGVVFATLMQNLGYSCDRAPYAVQGCVGAGFCVAGCTLGAKQSLHVNYLPQARAAGARIMTSTEAIDVRTISAHSLDGRPLRYAVRCRRDGTELMIRASIVVLGGGTVGTAKLLLRSQRYLTFLGDHVGRNIAVNGSVKAIGVLPEGFIEGDMSTGRSHPGVISYEFFDKLSITISTEKPLPVVAVGTAHLSLPGGTFWGRSHQRLMQLFRRRTIALYALGLTAPTAGIRRLGSGEFQPYLDIDDELRRYYHDTHALLCSILTRNGCEVVDYRSIDSQGAEHDEISFGTAHMTGSCRMAESRAHGVVDAAGEVFAYPGLYVADGAAVPSSLAVNSSLTILANAERIAAGIVERYRDTSEIARTASR